MTLNDYLQRVHTVNLAWDRIGNQLVIASALTLLVLSAAVWIFAVGAAPGWMLAALLLPLLVCFVLNLSPPPALWSNLDLRVGLVCPTCGGSLFRTQGRTRVAEVVESGKCPTCYADVFEQPYVPPVIHHPTVVTASAKSRISVRQAAFFLFVIVFYWSAQAKLNFDYCSARYAVAHTAEDSAAVDQLPALLAPTSGTGAGRSAHRPYCRSWRARDVTRASTFSVAYPLGPHAPSFTESSVWLFLTIVAALLPSWRAVRLARRPI